MADRDAPPGSVTGRTPPLGARGRSSSFPNLNPFGGGAGTDGAVDEGETADGFERVATPREEARTNAVWYLPPLGLRHLSEVRGRNLVPPRGAEHSRGAGFRFTLALHPPNDGDDGADANDDARVVYTSELAVDTLNPDWEPLDDVELERCARGVSGATASSSSSGVDPRGPRRRSSRLTLTVWHVESPTRGGTARVTLSTPIALDDLIRVPTDGSNGTNAHALASIFGPFAADSLMNKDDDIAFPPNTPMVRLPPRTRYSRGVGGYVGYDGVGSSSGSTTWYVPGGCAWRALKDSAVKEDGKDAADAVDAVDSLLARERGDGTSEGAGGFKEPVAIGSPIARGSRVKRTDGFELRRSIESIVKVAADLGEVVARRDELRDAIGASEVTAPSSTGATSTPSLVALKGRLSDATRDVAALRRRVNELRGATRTRAEAKALRSAALEAGTKRLGVARARLAENDAMVSGAHGRGRLHQQQRALVARRWQLVADLASVFPIAPARTGHQSGGGVESSRGGGKQKRTWSIAGVPLDLGQSGKPQGANSLSNAIGNGLLPGSTVRFFVFPYLQLDRRLCLFVHRFRSRNKNGGRRRSGTSRRLCCNSRRCSTCLCGTRWRQVRRGVIYATFSPRGRGDRREQ